MAISSVFFLFWTIHSDVDGHVAFVRKEVWVGYFVVLQALHVPFFNFVAHGHKILLQSKIGIRDEVLELGRNFNLYKWKTPNKQLIF